jgi:hypothetical protein
LSDFNQIWNPSTGFAQKSPVSHNLSGGFRADTLDKRTDDRTEGRTNGLTDSLIQFPGKIAILWRLTDAGTNNTYLDRHVNCPIRLFDFNKIWNSEQIFIQAFNLKLHRNPSSGSRADVCRQTDGRTDMTRVTGASRDYANASKNTRNSNKQFFPLALRAGYVIHM